MTEKLLTDLLTTVPATYLSSKIYIIGQTVVNFTDANEILLLDDANCQTACGSLDKGQYYAVDKS